MNENHNCQHEEDFGRIKTELGHVQDHVRESSKVGGIRDRLAAAEWDIKQLKCSGRIICLCAMFGALIGNSIPVLGKIISAIVKVCGFNL